MHPGVRVDPLHFRDFSSELDWLGRVEF